ncbi:MAG: glycogen synthase GlgA [Pseudomonadota bacterium]
MQSNQSGVLFVTSEVYPLIKTGGLADVSNTLPSALRQLGLDVRILLPGYPDVFEILDWRLVENNIRLFSGVALEPASLYVSKIPNGETPVYALNCPSLFQRHGNPYHDELGQPWPDNALRFGALSKAAALLASHIEATQFTPMMVHCNDWQTGLTPLFLQQIHSGRRIYTLMSIHNMAHQGVFTPDIIPTLELPWESFSVHGLEYYGAMSFLKAGLYYADWINTVSPTYAEEIQTESFGFGLQGLLYGRRRNLTGFMNGIDTNIWNPSTDIELDIHYNAKDLSGKLDNKKALCERTGLSFNAERPLLACITRLSHQKGIDLLISIMPEVVQEGAQLVILGSGESLLEQQLESLAQTWPENISITLGYDEPLAHLIEAGADIFLMPSRFEPCGLNQMYSMRYGTVPVVRRTGGLADSVCDVTPTSLDNKTATGFVFEQEDARQLLQCIQRALLIFRDKPTWQQIQLSGMTQDFTWENSAQQYLALYQQLTGSQLVV